MSDDEPTPTEPDPTSPDPVHGEVGDPDGGEVLGHEAAPQIEVGPHERDGRAHRGQRPEHQHPGEGGDPCRAPEDPQDRRQGQCPLGRHRDETDGHARTPDEIDEERDLRPRLAERDVTPRVLQHQAGQRESEAHQHTEDRAPDDHARGRVEQPRHDPVQRRRAGDGDAGGHPGGGLRAEPHQQWIADHPPPHAEHEDVAGEHEPEGPELLDGQRAGRHDADGDVAQARQALVGDAPRRPAGEGLTTQAAQALARPGFHGATRRPRMWSGSRTAMTFTLARACAVVGVSDRVVGS